MSAVTGGSPDAPNLWAVSLLLAYLLIRTAFLTTVEAPEPRYVIPCYPAVLALAAMLFVRPVKQKSESITVPPPARDES